jgi:outer membrane protein assembly factor BamB
MNRLIVGFLLSLLSFTGLVSSRLQANETLVLSRWALELQKRETALARFQTYRVSGLEDAGDSWIMPDPYGLLQRRHKETGGIIWQTALEGESQSLWRIDGDKVYGGDSKGVVYCVSLATGEILWTARTKGVFFAQPLVHESRVYFVNSLGTLQAYDKTTGQWLWQQTDPSLNVKALWSFQGPVLWQGHIVSGFPSALVQMMNAETGDIIWKQSFSAFGAGTDNINDVKALLATPEFLIASSFSGNLKVWNKAKQLVWEKKLSLYASPILSQDQKSVLIVTREGQVMEMTLDSGYIKWTYQVPRGLATAPVQVGSTLWIGTSEGSVTALSLDGKKIAESTDYESAILNPGLGLQDGSVIFLTSQGVLRRLNLVSTQPIRSFSSN